MRIAQGGKHNSDTDFRFRKGNWDLKAIYYKKEENIYFYGQQRIRGAYIVPFLTFSVTQDQGPEKGKASW